MGSTLLLLLAAAAAATVLQALPANSSLPACRAIPGSDDWPAPSAWAKLNETTGGRLLRAQPPGGVCFPNMPNYDATKCAIAQTFWPSDSFHSEDPVSVEWNNWTNDSCIPLPQHYNCTGTGYPVYVINATTPQHVKAGIDFARASNIRLIVKNSGHDFVGRSTAPNSLSIWVHHMRGLRMHEKEFKLAGCNTTIEGHAVTALAGTQMLEAYEETAKVNRTVVGGMSRTVAFGGFILGAGHSPLSPKYGLAADLVLEMKMVTPQGEILTANECQNTDLFWAARGGGPMTFGVLTSVTMKTVPTPEVLMMDFTIKTPSDNPQAFDMLAYVVAQFPDLVDKGLSGYPLIYSTVPNFIDNTTSLIKGMIGRVMLLDTHKVSDMMDLWQPIFDHINATWTRMTASVNITAFRTFNDFYRIGYDSSSVGHESVTGSRLLDRDALTSSPANLRAALAKIATSSRATVYMVSGKGVHNAKPRGGGNAVHPAWRKTYVHSTASVFFMPQDIPDKNRANELVEFYITQLKDLAPNMGAYMNEASRYEADWKNAYWGENYDRLLKIKRVVDPDDLFWCTPCVGSERWQEVNGTKLCRVPQ